jgi:hypothetical protein
VRHTGSAGITVKRRAATGKLRHINSLTSPTYACDVIAIISHPGAHLAGAPGGHS